jgi:hypothetical protein
VVVCAGCVVLALIVLPWLYWQAANYVPPFEYPARLVPSPNGYEVAVRAVSRIPVGSPLLRAAASDEEWRKRTPGAWEHLAAKQRPDLLAIRRAFSLEWQVPRSAKAAAPDPVYLAGLFALESRLAAAQGEQATALQWSLDAIELGGNLCRGGTVERRYTAQSCQTVGLEEAERILPHLAEGDLLRAAGRVRRIREAWPTIGETLENEHLAAKVKSTEFLRELAKHSLWEQLDQAGARANEPPVQFQLFQTSQVISLHGWGTWQRTLTPHAMVAPELDRYYRDLIAASGRPAPHGVVVNRVTNLWAEPYANSSFTGCYRGEWPRHNLALLETALIVAHYRRVRGRDPRSLDEIPAEWWPQVPVDVWGQQVRYRLKGGRSVVYSIGPDGVDEGGRAVYPSSVIDGGTGDLVFGKLCDDDWPEAARTY